MRTLKKLLYVACTASLLTSCEETYNDKLFWPGELNQEYGSYIKPATLDLTYSGEKLVGKTVDFKTDDSEKRNHHTERHYSGRKNNSYPNRFMRTGRFLYIQWKEYHNERGNGDIQRNPHSENDETGFECSNATK